MRRLDRLSRQGERLQRDLTISVEALALFIHYWLTLIPTIPESAQAAAQAKGRERFAVFIENLGRRLAAGKNTLRDISRVPKLRNQRPLVHRGRRANQDDDAGDGQLENDAFEASMWNWRPFVFVLLPFSGLFLVWGFGVKNKCARKLPGRATSVP